jgi:hypothetical protein
VQISREFGSPATLSTVPIEGGLFVLGEHAVLACDGRAMTRIDTAIPTWVLDNVDRLRLLRAFAFKYLGIEQIWLSLFKNDAIDKTVLVLDQTRGAWAEFDYPYSVYCNVRADTFAEVVWDTLPDVPWDTSPTFDVPWDSYGTINSSRTLIGLSTAGEAHAISALYLTGQNGAAFPAVSGRSQLLNPFVEKGLDCSLGWLDIQCSRHDGSSLVVGLYRDFDTSPYTSVTVDLTGSGTGQRVRRRVPVNCVAQFHAFEFATNTPNFNIDAVELYAAPARAMQMSA